MAIDDAIRGLPDVQTSLVRLACHHHQRLLHDGAERSRPRGLGVDLAARDGERPPGFEDFRLGDQALSCGRRKKVQLVFDGEHARIGRKECKPRVSVRGIGDGVSVRVLDPAAYALRHALAVGVMLEEAAGEALAVDPSFDLIGAIQDLLQDQIFSDFTLST